MARQPDVQYIRFYTDGSAARKVAPAVPIDTIRMPRVKKMKKIVLRIDPIATAGIAMAVVMFILMLVGVAQLNAARRELDTMSAYVNTLQQENAFLNAEYTQGYDLGKIEKTALALGMVPQEQVKHVTVSMSDFEAAEEPGAWERFYIFLTGLFA